LNGVKNVTELRQGLREMVVGDVATISSEEA
jgi:hypothetical protein